jgi:hypothetical protein
MLLMSDVDWTAIECDTAMRDQLCDVLTATGARVVCDDDRLLVQLPNGKEFALTVARAR